MKSARRWRDGVPRRSLVRIGAMLAVTALAIAGCGGDSGGSAGSTGGTVTAGVLVPLTGELGAFGKPWQQAAQMAIDEMNKSGQLPGGAKLKASLADSKTSPEVAVAQARKMISAQGAQLIFGPTSEGMLALAPIAERSRTPVISSSAGTVGLNNIAGKWLYRTVASDNADGKGLARYMADKGATSAALLVENNASPISVGQTFADSFKQAGGTVSTTVKLNPGQSSYRAEVGRVMSANPAWIVCTCGQQVGTSVLKTLHAAGYDGERMVSADLVSPGGLKAIGSDVAQNMYGGIAQSDTSLPAYKRFASAYKARFGSEPEPFASNSYDAMIIAGLAMVEAKSTKGADLNKHIIDVTRDGKKVNDFAAAAKALQNGEDIDYDGASGPVDMDDRGTAASSFAIFQARNGEWKQIKFYSVEDLNAQ